MNKENNEVKIDEEVIENNDAANSSDENAATDTEQEVIAEKTELEKAEEAITNLSDRLMRTAAEFDNYKKRTIKEKDEVYGNAVCDTVAKLLPVLDNLERAVAAAEEVSAGQENNLADGVKMVKKQFEDALSDIGVKPIEAVGNQFDPEKHNAVMTADSDMEENTVLEEFMKGYEYKDKIVRHSMVKVSN